mmetsp:Transcript_17438/g.35201  ORF Transcript_17438/g.35201 Transcript_17438/m.35201 type:complete len:210 (+) Transcript_17438:83-712(+)
MCNRNSVSALGFALHTWMKKAVDAQRGDDTCCTREFCFRSFHSVAKLQKRVLPSLTIAHFLSMRVILRHTSTHRLSVGLHRDASMIRCIIATSLSAGSFETDHNASGCAELVWSKTVNVSSIFFFVASCFLAAFALVFLLFGFLWGHHVGESRFTLERSLEICRFFLAEQINSHQSVVRLIHQGHQDRDHHGNQHSPPCVDHRNDACLK